MITLFENIYHDKRSVSFAEVQFMLRLFQQDLKTALLDISYPNDDRILLLLNSGKSVCAYTVQGGQTTRHPAVNLVDLFQGRERGMLRVCDLMPSCFGAVRTLIEQNTSSKTLVATSELSGMIQKWQADPLPSFVHILWPKAEGFVFIPGNNFSARQYAFLAEDKLSDSAGAVSMFSHWYEPECSVSRYTDQGNYEIWQENNLQLGFSLLLEHSLRRYTELAGRSLSLKLDDAINRLCQSHSWNIILGNSTVDNVHIFDTSKDAVSAYRTIFDLASRQITQVIGSRLFSETVDSGLTGLSEPLRFAVKNNILTH